MASPKVLKGERDLCVPETAARTVWVECGEAGREQQTKAELNTWVRDLGLIPRAEYLGIWRV